MSHPERRIPFAGDILESLDTGSRYVVLPRDDIHEDAELILCRIEDGRLATRAFYRHWPAVSGRCAVCGFWDQFLPLARQMPISNRSNPKF